MPALARRDTMSNWRCGAADCPTPIVVQRRSGASCRRPAHPCPGEALDCGSAIAGARIRRRSVAPRDNKTSPTVGLRVARQEINELRFFLTICFSWQEWQGSNLRPPVLETGALPIELHSYGTRKPIPWDGLALDAWAPTPRPPSMPQRRTRCKRPVATAIHFGLEFCPGSIVRDRSTTGGPSGAAPAASGIFAPTP